MSLSRLRVQASLALMMTGWQPSGRALSARRGWMRRRHEWDVYLASHPKQDRLAALIRICPDLDGATYWRLFGEQVWTEAELLHLDRNLWEILLDMYPEQRDAMMTESERFRLASLPDTLEVYRGAGTPGHASNGMSWTIDRSKADWFARRFPSKAPAVAIGVVRRADVIGYLDGRGESEIIALPGNVKITRVETMPIHPST